VDLAFAECGVFFLDNPEIELLENRDEIADCVLLGWLLTMALCSS